MSNEQPWYKNAERGPALGMKIIVWIALTLGRRLVSLVLAGVVFYYVLFFARARAASRLFLGRVQTAPVSLRQIFRHFYTFALVTVDRLYFLSNRWRGFDIGVEGRQYIDQHVDAGRGCLLLMSHFGSFDIIRALGREQKNIRAKVLMDRDYAQKVMSLLNAVNADMASDIVNVEQPPAQLMLQLQELLAQGNLVGVMADRVHKSERRVEQPFLSGRVHLPAGPWQLAAALKIPVIACFGVYCGFSAGKAQYRIYFLPVADASELSRKERQAWMQTAQADYVKLLEKMARQFPYNWFNFYDYWTSDETASH